MKEPHSRTAKSIASAAVRRGGLIASLPSATRQQLIASCEPVDLPSGAVLYEPGDRIRYVYFPIDGFVALVSSTNERVQIGAGLVGAEGMVGISVLLGVNVAPLLALVQGAGAALRLPSAEFSRELKRNPRLDQVLKRYLYVLMSQRLQAATCSRFHTVPQRLASWLLTTRDRAHSNEFPLTHRVTAYMLGARREGVSTAAGKLKDRELIDYRRSFVTILDGNGLEAASCECYGANKETHARVMAG